MSTEKNKRDEGKDDAMLMEKKLMASYIEKVHRAKDEGKKITYTFVPGGLTEILHCFDVIPVFPEVLGLQMGMRRIADQYIEIAENEGYSDDICSYVKSSVGMHLKDNVGPYGRKLPEPDFLFLVFVLGLQESGVVQAVVLVIILEFTVPGLITDGAVQRMFGQQEFQDSPAGLANTIGLSADLDALAHNR